MGSSLPEIVVDTRLDVQVHPEFTIHFSVDEGTAQTPTGRPLKHQEKWRPSQHIGTGGFGSVWRYTCVSGRSRGQHHAIKEIKCEGGLGVPSSRLSRELEAIGKFSQKRVSRVLFENHTIRRLVNAAYQYRHCFVESFGWYESGASLFVVMEYLDMGDLSHYIHDPLPESEAAGIVHQLLEGICYMHDNNFVHRDLKPEVRLCTLC
jgi:serine/threonine protein kinase